jgi:hypothetical protein
MLDRAHHRPAILPPDTPPLLVVVVDTEEEFDWAKPFDRDATAVSSVRHQIRAHRIFETYSVKPTYVMDYPVASKPEGYGPLGELYRDGLCQIGAHLHPWVNPPHDEVVTSPNSYPGNLPADLEKAKLQILTETIAENFGARPVIYKAGRYGVGPHTTQTLVDLGYRIDVSVVAESDLRDTDNGPDFRQCGAAPYFFGPGHALLEVPLSVCYAGVMPGLGRRFYGTLKTPLGERLRLPGICSRLGLFERLRLTPEGIGFDEHRRLTEIMLARGHKVFSLAYHSPSLDVGHTPYVRSQAELETFLDRFRRYFDYFFGDLGGRPATPDEVLALSDDPGTA